MAISEMLMRLLELLGIKKSDSTKFQRLKEKIRTAKATNVDRLEALKEQIQTLQRKVLAKKKEYDAAKGKVKQIVAGEIERLFKELDGLKGREAIIGQQIDKASIAAAKVGELMAADQQGIDESVFDELAVELEDIFADLKATDRAAEGLEQVSYEAPKAAQIDVDSRIAELKGEDESTKESTSELSESTVKRLKELAGEE